MDRSSFHDTHVTLALDIGGTHVTAVAVRAHDGNIMEDTRCTVAVDSAGPAAEIFAHWGRAGLAAMRLGLTGTSLAGVGVAMPGPFDYEHAVSLMQGQAKFDRLYGMDVRAALRSGLGMEVEQPIIFRNDATCFVLGEQWYGAAQGFSDVLGITLGTGFGSGFMRGGEVVESGEGVPQDGWLYNAPFRDGIADDSFSTRGLMGRVPAAMRARVRDGKELADLAGTDGQARRVYERFGSELAEFLTSWISGFSPQCLVVGGGLAKAWELFSPALVSGLSAAGITAEIRQARQFEDAALLGAAVLPLKYREPAAPAGPRHSF